MSIGAIAQKEVTSFKTRNVKLSDGSDFNQYKNIRRIIRYTNSEFMDGDNAESMFYNISNQRIPLYAKSIDANSKEFKSVGVGKTNWYQAWVLNVMFKKWVRDTRFALTLDDISGGIALYGSSVWKQVIQSDGTVFIEECDLRNLYFDPSVKNIVDSPVIELHYFNEQQLRAKYPKQAQEIMDKSMAKDQQTDDVDNVNTDNVKYTITERWGLYEGEYIHYIGSGSGDAEVVIEERKKTYTKKNTPKDFPYDDFHGERIRGRWQGLGIVERLYELQEQINTLVNQNSETNNIASLLLFKTADAEITGNILDGVNSGQILNTEDLQQLSLDNRFIATFLNQVQLIESKADMLCYINESISGETPPSGVPFRSLAVATRAAVSTFDYIKTHINEKMGYIIEEKVMPSLVKGFNKVTAIEISEGEEDIRAFDEMKIEKELETYKKERAGAGYVVFEEDLAAIVENMQNTLGRDRRVEKIKKNFFDFEYGIVINPTGEAVDKNTMNANIDSALEYMISAPAVVNTPLYKQKLSNNGIPPFRLTPMQQQELEQTSGSIPNKEASQDNLSQQSAV